MAYAHCRFLTAELAVERCLSAAGCGLLRLQHYLEGDGSIEQHSAVRAHIFSMVSFSLK